MAKFTDEDIEIFKSFYKKNKQTIKKEAKTFKLGLIFITILVTIPSSACYVSVFGPLILFLTLGSSALGFGLFYWEYNSMYKEIRNCFDNKISMRDLKKLMKDIDFEDAARKNFEEKIKESSKIEEISSNHTKATTKKKYSKKLEICQVAACNDAKKSKIKKDDINEFVM